uniref:Uncharacterized protein n=1 Tax=Anguilla anguilla TaxID=7936 RepID=A0A0E9Q5E2_ANGAN
MGSRAQLAVRKL